MGFPCGDPIPVAIRSMAKKEPPFITLATPFDGSGGSCIAGETRNSVPNQSLHHSQTFPVAE
jgi:hypothetical protein